MEKLSVIIPTMKGREEKLLRLLETIPAGCEIIVIDDENLLLAAKRNKGAALASGDYLLFIDDDNVLARDAVRKIRSNFNSSIGIMGMVACYEKDKTRVADGGSLRSMVSGFMYGVNTNKKIEDIPAEPYEVDEVANAFMIPAKVFNKVRGFDQDNFPIDLDEADICRRIKALGMRVMMCPEAVCYHDSITYSFVPDFRRPMNAYFMGRNRVFYQKKHLKKGEFLYYLYCFFPVFVLFYSLSLLYRRKLNLIPHFLKGAIDGLQGRRQNKFQ